MGRASIIGSTSEWKKCSAIYRRICRPSVGRNAKQPRPRVARRLCHDAEGHERPGHRLLSQVLGVPRAPREMPAVSVEIGAERLVRVEKAPPRLLDGGAQQLLYPGAHDG